MKKKKELGNNKRLKIFLIISIIINIGLLVHIAYNKIIDKKKINESNDPKTSVTIGNPVAGMSREEAEKIAKELGEGRDFGTWGSMSGEEFLQWWRESNNIIEE